jgi:glycosyltransferase involved in cell wall biosynthesis
MNKTKILFEGHDLKFLTHVINHFKNKKDYDVEVYTYPGHVITDTEKMLMDLPGYDIIFCEWGLGNLKWFSHNKYPGQKLVTRVHLQEFFTPYLKETNWANVDKVIVVGPLMKEKFDRLFPEYHEKCIVIPNLIDTISFHLEKKAGSVFNLGLLGILPKRKAPHLGLEILKELRKTDERYKLFIKSKRPEELDWLWKKPEEQEYYKEFFQNVDDLGLQDAVIFEPHGSNVQEWFRNIGFILSTSDFESFHLSIAEGMASGAIPIIRNWDGAKALFPERLMFDDTSGAASLILSYSDPLKYENETKALKTYCTSHFSLDVLLPGYDKILSRDIDRKKMRKALKKLIYEQQEIMSHEKMLLQENQKLKTDLTTLHETNNKLRADLASYLETNNKLKTDVTAINETNNKLKADVEKLRTDVTTIRETNQKYASEMNSLKNELKENKRHYDQMQNSLSWKVGSALIGKPAGFFKSLRKK